MGYPYSLEKEGICGSLKIQCLSAAKTLSLSPSSYFIPFLYHWSPSLGLSDIGGLLAIC